MLPSTIELVLVGLSIAALIASGFWTNWRFSGFAQLPAHYDFRGQPTRFSPRATMAWLLPAMFSALLLVLVFVFSAVPQEMRKGDPIVGVLVCCLTCLGVQALILWLHIRWARGQG